MEGSRRKDADKGCGEWRGPGPPGLPRQIGRRAGILGVVQMHQRDIRALAGTGDRHGATDAAVCAGDEGLQTGKPGRATPAVLAVIGRGLHLAKTAGQVLVLVGEGGFGTTRPPVVSSCGFVRPRVASVRAFQAADPSDQGFASLRPKRCPGPRRVSGPPAQGTRTPGCRAGPETGVGRKAGDQGAGQAAGRGAGNHEVSIQ